MLSNMFATMRFLLILCAFLLAGCAEQQFWHKVYPDLTINHPVKIAVVPNPSFWCGTTGEIACAMRDIEHDECSILVTTENRWNKCVIEHETWHCKGYDHPNFVYSLPSCQGPIEAHR